MYDKGLQMDNECWWTEFFRFWAMVGPRARLWTCVSLYVLLKCWTSIKLKAYIMNYGCNGIDLKCCFITTLFIYLSSYRNICRRIRCKNELHFDRISRLRCLNLLKTEHSHYKIKCVIKGNKLLLHANGHNFGSALFPEPDFGHAFVCFISLHEEKLQFE